MRAIKTILWNCGFNVLPLPRFINRLLWKCGVNPYTCPETVRPVKLAKVFRFLPINPDTDPVMWGVPVLTQEYVPVE